MHIRVLETMYFSSQTCGVCNNICMHFVHSNVIWGGNNAHFEL